MFSFEIDSMVNGIYSVTECGTPLLGCLYKMVTYTLMMVNQNKERRITWNTYLLYTLTDTVVLKLSKNISTL